MGWSTVNLDEEKQQQDVRRARSRAGGQEGLLGAGARRGGRWAGGSALPSPPWGRRVSEPWPLCVNGVYGPRRLLCFK